MKLSRVLALVAVVGAAFTLPDCTDNENSKFPQVPLGDDGEPIAPAQPAQPHANKNPQPKVTECDRKFTASTTTCTVKQSGSGGKVIQGTVLGANEVFHNGEILFDDDGFIQCVACDCSGRDGYNTSSVITCADAVISPGFLNPHEHMGYQNNRPIAHGTDRYEKRADWGRPVLNYRDKAPAIIQAGGELRFLMGGATSIAGAGGVKGFLRNLDVSSQPDLMEGLPASVARSTTFPLSPDDTSAKCPYTNADPKSTLDQLEGYLPHISEGIDSESRNEFLCASEEGDKNLVVPQTGIIHAVATNAKDAVVIQKRRSKVVWSPRSNTDLYGNTAQAVMLDIAGVMISLGSDWVPSGSMNMLRELRCADEWNQQYFDKHFTDADLWRMATTNAAYAMGVGHAVGLLKEGYVADIAVFDAKKSRDFRAVLDAGVEDVALVLRGGRAMYGEEALILDPLWGSRDGCEAFEGGVCGKDRAVCIDAVVASKRPTLAQIRTAIEAPVIDPESPNKNPFTGYPLFFCKDKTPEDEPSCHPMRPSGAAIYSGNPSPTDSDGDGIPDSLDDCPKIFNPIRPMDLGRQADADNDGIGDACDECPFDKTQQCTRVTSGDIDGDGVPNELDNCPEAANPKQEDDDEDGRGNACDSCPAKNPGAVGCPLSLEEIRNPDEASHPPTRTSVAFDGYVSAKISGKALYIQRTTEGGPWQGIYVFAGGFAGTAEVGPKIGQRVHVVGRYTDVMFDGTYLPIDSVTAGTVVTTSETTELMKPYFVEANQLNTAAGARAEPYESLLVHVGDVDIVNDNPDQGQFWNFVVTGDLRVADTLYKNFGAISATSAACTEHPNLRQCAYPRCAVRNTRRFTKLTGILGYSFGNRKLYPRGISQAATGSCCDAEGKNCKPCNLDFAPDYVPNPCNDPVP